MRYRERATVVQFPAGGPSRQRPAARGGGTVLHLWRPDVDARLNQAWDDLLAATDRAWNWRDPESLKALEGCLRRIGSAVDDDWA
jgi:hypothetical protein